VANRTAPERVEAIAKLRQLRFTAAEIAKTLGIALSTSGSPTPRSGMGRRGRLGARAGGSLWHSRSGGLVHADFKKLGRIGGGAG